MHVVEKVKELLDDEYVVHIGTCKLNRHDDNNGIHYSVEKQLEDGSWEMIDGYLWVREAVYNALYRSNHTTTYPVFEYYKKEVK